MDPTTEDGLLDLTLLNIILELILFFDPQYHDDDTSVPQDELAERQNILQVIANFQALFCQQQQLVIDDELLNPRVVLFDPYFLRICVAVIRYKEIMAEFDESFTHESLLTAVSSHITTYRPHLLDAFLSDVKKDDEKLPYLRTFNWTGSHFKVVEYLSPSGEMFESEDMTVDTSPGGSNTDAQEDRDMNSGGNAQGLFLNMNVKSP
jgi:hypothetical protein